MRTIPLSTATPKRAMKPIPAEILNGNPLSSKAQIPPIADNGIAVKIKAACGTEPNVKYNRINMSANAIGTAMESLSFAAQNPQCGIVYGMWHFGASRGQ